MKEKNYIEIRITDKNNTLRPNDLDINEIKELISDVETFLYPTTQKKKKRPPIGYDLEEGSIKHKFFVAIAVVNNFNVLIGEIKKHNSIDFLEPKRQQIIDKFQKTAKNKAYNIELNNSLDKEKFLCINERTAFQMNVPKFYESEFYLYGEIYREGGKKPNIHIYTEEFGNLTIKATKEQIIAGEKKIYKSYGVKVKGKKYFENKPPSDLELLEFVAYNPVFDKSLLDIAIQKASKNLSKIKDVDAWIQENKDEKL